MSDPVDARRTFLKSAAALSVAIAASGCAGDDEVAVDPADPGVGTPYRENFAPAFFTTAEWTFMTAVADRLIPADALGPGAVEVGALQYLDHALRGPFGVLAGTYREAPFHQAPPELGYQSPLNAREQYRRCIAAIEADCADRFGKGFAQLAADDQDRYLRAIERGAITHPELDLEAFFSIFLLKNINEGYFCDPMYGGNRDMAAWTMIGYPGARADYRNWLGRHGRPYPYAPVDVHGREA